MQIVIDVDMDSCVHDAEGTDYFIPDLHTYISENMLEILKKKGKILPKGHGRLIDADVLKQSFEEQHDFFLNACGGIFLQMSLEDKIIIDGISNSIAEVVNSPTIIEADKEVQNE